MSETRKSALQVLYNDAVLKAKDSVITKGANHPDTILLIQQARLLNDKLTDSQREIGVYSNPAGNYKTNMNDKPMTVKEFLQIIYKLTVYALAIYGLYKLIRGFF